MNRSLMASPVIQLSLSMKIKGYCAYLLFARFTMTYPDYPGQAPVSSVKFFKQQKSTKND